MSAGHVRIGARAFIGHDVLISGGDAEVSIQEDVDIAPRVVIVSGTHEIDLDGPRIAGRGLSRPIVIENGAWIGAGSIILGGVRIGHHSIVAAGSVVGRNVPPYTLAAGVPSTVRKALRAERDLQAGSAE